MAFQPSTIHEAISCGSVEDLKRLIQEGKTEEMNKLDGSGRTPLTYCVNGSSGGMNARTTTDMPEEDGIDYCVISVLYLVQSVRIMSPTLFSSCREIAKSQVAPG